eukprot:GHUV01015848.1.p1 GENE.GHUV01015848.1~~GHUV01015848.1.p1  ORF type:complete len:444 (+),score=154.44 GHUV01015848.1:131-1462(+)
MAMATRPVTSTIWVGNLPFDVTEAELIQVLGQAGPVKNLRLISDKETGKAKGFGFVEYYDKATAESAFRNLNNTEVHGRNIRIDFAEDDYKTDRKGHRDRDDRPPPAERRDGGRDNRNDDRRMIGYAAAAQSAQQVAGMLGGTPASDRRTQDQLNELLAAKRAPELWEVLRLLRDQFGGDRQAAVNWFAERPGVAKAVFQAQVLLGMVKPPSAGPGVGAAAAAGPYVQQGPPGNFQEGPIGLGGRMGGPGGPPPPGPGSIPGPMPPGGPGPMPPPGQGMPPQGPGMPPSQGMQQGPGMPMQQMVVVDPATGQQQFMQVPQQQLGGPGMPMQQPQGMMQMPPQQQMHMTPQHQLQMQPMGQEQLVMQPIQQQQPQQVVMQPQQPASGGMMGALQGQDPQQVQGLLRQVINMTEEQISALPEQFRQQVLFVKEQIRIGAVKVEPV